MGMIWMIPEHKHQKNPKKTHKQVGDVVWYGGMVVWNVITKNAPHNQAKSAKKPPKYGICYAYVNGVKKIQQTKKAQPNNHKKVCMVSHPIPPE